MDIGTLIDQINKKYEEQRPPDKQEIVEYIKSVFSQINSEDRYSIARWNIDIHPDIDCLYINIEPQQPEPLTITYDRAQGYKGVDWQFMSYENLVAIKDKLPDILQHIIYSLEYEEITSAGIFADLRPTLFRVLELYKKTDTLNEGIIHTLKRIILRDPNDDLWTEYNINQVLARANTWLAIYKDKTDKEIDSEAQQYHDNLIKKQMGEREKRKQQYEKLEGITPT